MQRSRAHAGALVPPLAALLFGLVLSAVPRTILAADYDVEVDACALLDDAEIEGLTTWTAFTTDIPESSPSLSSCFWGSVRAGEPGYIELVVFRESGLDAYYSYDDDCVVTPVAGVGEEAAVVECPTELSMYAYERGAVVSLLVDQPAEPLTEDDLADVVRSVFGQLGSLAPSEPPSDWSASGRSTYAGTWTVTHYANDSDFGEPEATVGDSVPGTLTLDCIGEDSQCGFTSTWEDDLRWVVAIEVLEAGAGRFVDETQLDGNCPDGQLYRATYEATWGPGDASASVATVNEPRTCEWDEGSIVYSEDITWSFEGSLVEYVPPPSEDLASYLTSYGLTCTDDGGECVLEIEDEEGLDATYRVLTDYDDAGEISAIEAIVASLDDSMPSDAFGFLRGVAARAPFDDTDGAVTWLDTAVGGAGPEQYADDGWTAMWSTAVVGEGETWTLAIVRDDAVREPEPSASASPANPASPATVGVDAPAAEGAAPAAAEPRPFAASVPEPTEVSTDPTIVLQSVALAALLVFLMPFPSQLFNSTLEAHEDEVRRWFRLDRLGAVAGGIGAFWASWGGVALFTLLAALLYGFLDPGFGLELGSLATFVGMLLGIVLVTVAFALPVIAVHRRHGDRPSLKVVPVSLLIGVACVVLSRLTDFQPGYLYGLLIGLAFARELSAAEEGRATAIGAALMLTVAFGAWLTLGALPDGEAFALSVARTALAALMVAGLEGVVFGLLPMRFLPGEPLYQWNRVLWAGLLLIGAFAFFHILINPASGYLSDASRTPLFTVVALLLGFSLISVAFWAWFRYRPASSGSDGAIT